MGERDEKKRAMDLAIAQIEKQFGKGSIMKLGTSDPPVDVPAIPTGSLGLDLALGVGGIPRGRVVEIYGIVGKNDAHPALQRGSAEGRRDRGVH